MKSCSICFWNQCCRTVHTKISQTSLIFQISYTRSSLTKKTDVVLQRLACLSLYGTVIYSALEFVLLQQLLQKCVLSLPVVAIFSAFGGSQRRKPNRSLWSNQLIAVSILAQIPRLLYLVLVKQNILFSIFSCLV